MTGLRTNLYWLLVIFGILPAAISATILPTHWCLNIGNPGALFGLPPVGCLSGRSVSEVFISTPFAWAYLAAFVVGVWMGQRQRQYLRMIALLPLLLLAALPFLHVAQDGPEPIARLFPVERITSLDVNPSLQKNQMYFEGSPRDWSDQKISDVLHSSIADYSTDRSSLQPIKNIVEQVSEILRNLQSADIQLENAVTALAAANANIIQLTKNAGNIELAFENNGRSSDLGRQLVEARKNISLAEARLPPLISAENNAKDRAVTIEEQAQRSLNRLNKLLNSAAAEGPSHEIRRWTIIYSFAAFISLCVYTFCSPLRSAPFATAVLATFAIPFATQIAAAEALNFGSITLAVLFATYPALLLVVAAISLRLIALFGIQNWPQARLFGRRASLQLSLQSFLKWSPIGAALVYGLYVSTSLDQRAQEAVYDLKCTDQGPGFFQCAEADISELVPRDDTKNLEENINIALDRGFENQERQVEELLAEVGVLSERAQTEGPDIILDQYDEIFPTGEGLKSAVPSLVPPSCSWDQVGCRIVREIKIAVVDAYQSTRSRYRATVEKHAVELAEQSDVQVSETTEAIESELSLAVHTIKLRAKSTIEQVFWTNRAINLIMSTFLIVIAIKSFAYVTARIVYGNRLLGAHTISIDAPSAQSNPEQNIVAGFDPEYELQCTDFGKFYVKPSLSLSGRSQSVSWPQPLSAVLRRILAGTYKMIELDPAVEEPGDVTIRETEGREFVEWVLGAEDVVFFSMGNLAAFSETTSIETRVSLNFMAMAYGQMLFTIARGPGILLLRTRGKPDVFVADNPGKSVDAHRYIAWSESAAFVVSSSTKYRDIYFHSAQISYVSGGAAIVDVSEQSRSRSGAIKYIPPVLLPI